LKFSLWSVHEHQPRLIIFSCETQISFIVFIFIITKFCSIAFVNHFVASITSRLTFALQISVLFLSLPSIFLLSFYHW